MASLLGKNVYPYFLFYFFSLSVYFLSLTLSSLFFWKGGGGGGGDSLNQEKYTCLHRKISFMAYNPGSGWSNVE